MKRIILVFIVLFLTVSFCYGQNTTNGLFSSAIRGDLEGVKKALEKGTDVNVKTRFGMIPVEIVKEGRVVSIDAVGVNGGETALILAARKGHLYVVKYLIEKGANVYAQDDSGQTALDSAKEYGYTEIVNFLRKSGAIDSGNTIRNYEDSIPIIQDKGQYDQSIADYTRVIEINPRYAGAAYVSRGIAYCSKGEYDRAIGDCNKALEINPRCAEAYVSRGIAYYSKGEDDRAIEDYNKALEINPRYALAYNNRGNAYAKKGEDDRDIGDYNKALEINPRYAEAYANRAAAYYYKEEYNKAWEDVNKAQGLGYQVNPRLLELLRQASGRER